MKRWRRYLSSLQLQQPTTLINHRSRRLKSGEFGTRNLWYTIVQRTTGEGGRTLVLHAVNVFVIPFTTHPREDGA